MAQFPRLYAIVDSVAVGSKEAVIRFAEELVAAGCTLIQYRNKSCNARIMLDQAREIKKKLISHSHVSQQRRDVGHPKCQEYADAPGLAAFARPGSPVHMIMNDRADLCLAADFDGVHVGQEDLSPESARKIIGPDRWLGVSTHNPEQLRAADQTSADYVAIGPVFPTSSKENPDPVVGLEGVRRARALTSKPLVGIGGITRANARSVIEAGADSVAVISDLLRDPRKSAEEFLRILE